MRPLYESQGDLSREARVAERLCQAWDCQSLKLPVQYRVDFAMLVNRKIKAWLEVKCRNSYYDEMILSAAKFVTGQQLATSTNRPFVVAFGIGHDIYWRDCTHDQPELELGGRADRQDWQDMEPVVMLPLNKFHKL